MKRIDERTVELTDAERHLTNRYEDYLSAGLNIPDAAHEALDNYGFGPTISPEFVDYLSDGTLKYIGGQIIRNDCQVCFRGNASVIKVRKLRIIRLCTECAEDPIASSKVIPLQRSERGGVSFLVLVGMVLAGALLGYWLSPARGMEDYSDLSPEDAPSFTTDLDIGDFGVQEVMDGVVLSLVKDTEPYGGCDEAWMAPTSPGGVECGWRLTTKREARTFRRHFNQVNIHEPWRRCSVRVGSTTLISCPSGEVYSS